MTEPYDYELREIALTETAQQMRNAIDAYLFRGSSPMHLDELASRWLRSRRETMSGLGSPDAPDISEKVGQ